MQHVVGKIVASPCPARHGGGGGPCKFCVATAVLRTSASRSGSFAGLDMAMRLPLEESGGPPAGVHVEFRHLPS